MIGLGLDPVVAWPFALALAWCAVGAEAGEETIWDAVAYATRYGKGVGLLEALSIPVEDLYSFLMALSRSVERENEASKPKKTR